MLTQASNHRIGDLTQLIRSKYETMAALRHDVVVKCLSFKVGDRPKFKAIVIKMKVLVDTWGWSS